MSGSIAMKAPSWESLGDAGCPRLLSNPYGKVVQNLGRFFETPEVLGCVKRLLIALRREVPQLGLQFTKVRSCLPSFRRILPTAAPTLARLKIGL